MGRIFPSDYYHHHHYTAFPLLSVSLFVLSIATTLSIVTALCGFLSRIVAAGVTGGAQEAGGEHEHEGGGQGTRHTSKKDDVFAGGVAMGDKKRDKKLKHEDSVWKKTIILGEKCRVHHDSEEEIVLDEDGNRITPYRPKTSAAPPSMSRQSSAVDINFVWCQTVAAKVLLELGTIRCADLYGTHIYDNNMLIKVAWLALLAIFMEHVVLSKGYYPQAGYVLEFLPVPPNCLSLPDISDGMSIMSSAVTGLVAGFVPLPWPEYQQSPPPEEPPPAGLVADEGKEEEAPEIQKEPGLVAGLGAELMKEEMEVALEKGGEEKLEDMKGSSEVDVAGRCSQGLAGGCSHGGHCSQGLAGGCSHGGHCSQGLAGGCSHGGHQVTGLLGWPEGLGHRGHGHDRHGHHRHHRHGHHRHGHCDLVKNFS
nr:uncharacterized protein LOC109190921 [Ipomoea trifida]